MSRALVVAFALAFLAVALATTIAVAAALRAYTENNALFLGAESFGEWLTAHVHLVVGVAICTLGLMVLASLYRAATLSRGGGYVARSLGGTRVNAETRDPLERRLVNVVEEMAIASGLPVPEIYVLEQESGINAFAAGLASADAAIAVTRGALDQLDRSELQGVIAHEFSHIVNGDMRLNQQLMSFSFGILVLSLAGRRLLRSPRRGRNSGGTAAAVVIGLALAIIGGIGVLLARLIKAGVSRQRERLADASAVQFTREPQGLAGALKKIGGYSSRIVSVDTEEVAHMLFEHGSKLGGWFATHPPLIERIRALEPNFDPRDLPPPRPLPVARVEAADERAGAPLAAYAAPPPAASASPLERAGDIAAAAGHALHSAIPDELLHAARSRESSLLAVVALTLSSDASVREKQLKLVEQQLGAARAARARRLHGELTPGRPELRLPVLELALPALRQRPIEQLAYLIDLLARLQQLEPSPRLFDFVLLRVLEAYLRDVTGAEPARRAPRTLDARAAVRGLLAAVAAFGHDEANAARAAYEAGIASVGWARTPDDPTFEPPSALRDLETLEAALAALAPLKPRDKERVLRGVLATIRADAVRAVEERELFRVIAGALGTPLPPDVVV